MCNVNCVKIKYYTKLPDNEEAETIVVYMTHRDVAYIISII